MKKVKEVTVITCDLCGNPIGECDQYDGTSESRPLGIVSMQYDIWYGGIHQVSDTCKDCNFKLAQWLYSQKMINGQKIS